jgi:hypothetical protein
MQETLKAPGKTQLSRHSLISLVSELINGSKVLTPNPEDPNPPDPPWPWRHILNKAIDRMNFSISAQGDLLSRVALNPQPLPPKAYFAMALAQEVIDRAGMMHEIAAGLNDDSEQRGIIIVGGYITKFVDDICPTPPRIKFPRMKWPFPPEPDPNPSWSGLELAIIGTHFQNEARITGNKGIQKVFNEAGEKLLEAAISRI